MSLQVPLEETALTKSAGIPVEPSSDVAGHEKSEEAQLPMEESWLRPSVVSTTTVPLTTYATPQGVVTAVVSFFVHHH